VGGGVGGEWGEEVGVGREWGGGWGRNHYNFVAMIWFRTTTVLTVLSLGLLKRICTALYALAQYSNYYIRLN